MLHLRRTVWFGVTALLAVTTGYRPAGLRDTSLDRVRRQGVFRIGSAVAVAGTDAHVPTTLPLGFPGDGLPLVAGTQP